MRIVAIAGATASGKTRMAVEAARALGSEIVSVDSRQVYRGLDIGSGKDLDEYRRAGAPVRVHLVDVADPKEVYTVFHFQQACYRVLQEAERRSPFREGTPMILAGGSGLYLEAVLRGYRIPDVPEDPALRSRLMALDRAALIAELRRLDPARLERTDSSTRKRVVRALEVAYREARSPLRYSEPPPVRMTARLYVIDVGRAKLRERIARRLEDRLREGLVDEVRGLLDRGVPPERLRRLGLEYREVTSFLTGGKGYEEMTRDLRNGIFRFARRQEIWFRGMERRGIPVTRIRPGEGARIVKGEGRWFEAGRVPSRVRGEGEAAAAEGT